MDKILMVNGIKESLIAVHKIKMMVQWYKELSQTTNSMEKGPNIERMDWNYKKDILLMESLMVKEYCMDNIYKTRNRIRIKCLKEYL